MLKILLRTRLYCGGCQCTLTPWFTSNWARIGGAIRGDGTENLRNEHASRFHTLSQPKSNFLKRSSGLRNCFETQKHSVSSLSGVFVKLGELPKDERLSRFNRDEHYEKVESQNFGPVPAAKSDVPTGHYSLTSWEYGQRNFLTYDDIPYGKLPIAFIRAKYNNTIVSIASHDEGKKYTLISCGIVGFKNVKKKSRHAAETVGKQAAERALLRDCPKHVRVKIKGAGYGRKEALRGLVLGGLQIASITDVTPLHVDGLPQRPRKIRRM